MIDNTTMNNEENGSSPHAGSGAERARQLLQRYHQQILDGCGNSNCTNEHCATGNGGRNGEHLSVNEAAARALQLFRDKVPCCVSPTPVNERFSSAQDVQSRSSPSAKDGYRMSPSLECSTSGSSSARSDTRNNVIINNGNVPAPGSSTRAESAPKARSGRQPVQHKSVINIDSESDDGSEDVATNWARNLPQYDLAGRHNSDYMVNDEYINQDERRVIPIPGLPKARRPPVGEREAGEGSPGPSTSVKSGAKGTDAETKAKQKPAAPVVFLTESKIAALISECSASTDYGPIRRLIREVFCNPDSLIHSFRKSEALSAQSNQKSGKGKSLAKHSDKPNQTPSPIQRPPKPEPDTSHPDTEARSGGNSDSSDNDNKINSARLQEGNMDNQSGNEIELGESTVEVTSETSDMPEASGSGRLSPSDDNGGLSVDLDGVRRVYKALFAISGSPFDHALGSAAKSLAENAILDLKFQNAYSHNPDYINIFAILLELPALDASDYFSTAYSFIVKAFANLPLDGQARLVRAWAAKPRSPAYSTTPKEGAALMSEDLPVNVKRPTLDDIAQAETARLLLQKLQAAQHLLTMTTATGNFSRQSPLQENDSITSAACLIRALYYASLYGPLRDLRNAPGVKPNAAIVDDRHGGVTRRRRTDDTLEISDDGDSDDERWESVHRHRDLSRSWAFPSSDMGPSDSDTRGGDELGTLLGIRPGDIRTSIVPFEEFYNDMLSEDVNMECDYINYKSQIEDQFSFLRCCPFLLSVGCKVQGLWYDNRIRMIAERREAVIDSLIEGSPHQPYLKIQVRRDNVVADALFELELIAAEAPSNLKKQLYVEFAGEAGVDEGGLSKEFYQIVTEHLFNPDYGMWIYHEDSRLYWFSPQRIVPQEEYTLVGLLFGLAIYNAIIFDVKFPIVLYRKLVGNEGILCDLEDVDPVLFRSLMEVLSYDGDDIEDVFCLTYQITFTDVFGHVHSHDLKPGGDKIPVTKENREEFATLYADFLLNESVAEQFKAFKKGFQMVTSESPILSLFRPEEIEQLVCGSPHLDFNALENSTVYDNGFNAQYPLIKWFWEIVHEMTEDEKRLLLQFSTGSDRVPVGGLANMKFIIAKNGPDSDRLPTAHTCFNVMLIPDYASKDKLKKLLLKAIFNSKGFGLM